MLKKLKFKGGFFYDEIELELFANNDRISLLYGKNGSGKSTISKAISKVKGNPVKEIVDATLYDQEDKVYTDVQCIHVFNEEYINSRVKLREDGLDTIVLLGELGNLEDKISDLELRIEAESKRNLVLRTDSEEYKDKKNKKSPEYFRTQINLGLSGDTHWAEREKIINDGKRNAGVTDKVIDTIVELSPTETLEELKKRYNEKFELLKRIRKNEAVQIRNTEKINISYDEATLQGLLSQKLERPILSERERYLLQLIDEGKLEQINEMKSVFSKKNTLKCPFCLQGITDQGKEDLISSIERVLSKEIEIHEEKLKKCIIQNVTVDLSGMEVLNSENYKKCENAIEDVNTEIFKIREIILKKINHPYTPIKDFESELNEKQKNYEIVRCKLQEEIDTYNDAVKRVEVLKRNLTDDNASIAHYEILRDIELWKHALEEQKKVDEDLSKSDEM